MNKIVVFLVLLALSFDVVLAHGGVEDNDSTGGAAAGYGGESGMMGTGMGGWWIFGSIFMILFWAVIILAIIWLYKQIRGPSAGAATESALDIAKKRYAKGGITKDEFEELKKEIESR